MTPDPGWVAAERLARLVSGADVGLLAVDRPSAATPEVRPPLCLVGGLDLAETRWVAVVADAAGRRWVAPLVLTGDGLRRARPGDGVAEALVAHLTRRPSPELGIEVTTWSAHPVTGERAITVDQTNESVVVGEEAVVKYALHQSPVGDAGPPPALHRLSVLAGAGFEGTPRPWGAVTMDVGEGGPLLLATIVAYLPGARDGWEWAVEDVRALARGAASMGDAVAPATRLGTLTADLHLALRTAGFRASTPEEDHRRWRRAQDDLDLAVAMVPGPEGVRLRSLAGQVEDALRPLAAPTGTPLIHVHGDLHVGQVLRRGEPADYVVVDFDGNPVLTQEERADPQPAAVDVAGMLASLDHVGRVVAYRTDGVDEALVAEWIREARARFLAAYRAGLADGGCPELFDGRLLHPLLVAQEVREYVYAVRHLPHWTYVPDQALPVLLEER